MTQYAAQTSVSSSKSRAEIERTLTRYGAVKFMYGWQDASAVVAFEMNERHIKFVLPLPDRADFARTATKRQLRSEEAQTAAYEQAVRQKWRALSLCIKAKLEAVESGITEFDDEFLAHIMMPGGETVGTMIKPKIEQAYLSGQTVPLLPDYSRQHGGAE